MPIEWGLILAAASIIAATTVLVYALSALKEWISNRIGVYRNHQVIAGALKDRLENGNYKVIPFIFDVRNNQTIEIDSIETEKLDQELENKFAGKDEVILEVSG